MWKPCHDVGTMYHRVETVYHDVETMYHVETVYHVGNHES